MPIIALGPVCERPGCRWPLHLHGLCLRCFRLARAIGIDPDRLARDPRLDAPPMWLAADIAALDRGET
jgi:hypothetical protein